MWYFVWPVILAPQLVKLALPWEGFFKTLFDPGDENSNETAARYSIDIRKGSGKSRCLLCPLKRAKRGEGQCWIQPRRWRTFPSDVDSINFNTLNTVICKPSFWRPLWSTYLPAIHLCSRQVSEGLQWRTHSHPQKLLAYKSLYPLDLLWNVSR